MEVDWCLEERWSMPVGNWVMPDKNIGWYQWEFGWGSAENRLIPDEL
jgi:hypothetical protein